MARTDSSLNGRGISKRATFSDTSDSKPALPSFRRLFATAHKEKPSTLPYVHAAERDDSDSPPLPPRIVRRRDSEPQPPPHESAIRAPIPLPAPSGHPVLPMRLTMEMITVATIADVNLNYANSGLLPLPAIGSSPDEVQPPAPSVPIKRRPR